MLGPEGPHASKSHYRPLYVGSDLELIAAVRKVLPEMDYQLVSCGDRGSAVLFLESDIPYHLLLIDYEWRGSEGLKLTQLAQSLAHRKQMPIIVVAATEWTRAMHRAAHKAGVKQIVMKSPDMTAVSDAIRSCSRTLPN